jgi:hypothetical protein
MRLATAVLAGSLLLAACGDEAPPPSDAELGAAIWQHAEAAGAVSRYEGCLRRVAAETRPSSDLGLERLDAVLAACKAEEGALVGEVERIWSAETREQLDGRVRGIRTEALRIVKDVPYVPPVVVVPR